MRVETSTVTGPWFSPRARITLFAVLTLSGAVATGCVDAPATDSADSAEADALEASFPPRGEAAADDPQLAFWASLESLCSQTFHGQVVESQPPDETFAGKTLMMQVRACTDEEIRIPFHVGEDRSRTWVLTWTETGLRLKHDHRHDDGTEDEVTQYGGDSRGPGTAALQEFYADAFTAVLVPAAATNIWSIEIEPGRIFAYALQREGTDRRFRVEFDLREPRAAAPPPWGG